jgi:hypothetical protein
MESASYRILAPALAEFNIKLELVTFEILKHPQMCTYSGYHETFTVIS